jgi:hypothetical protein
VVQRRIRGVCVTGRNQLQQALAVRVQGIEAEVSPWRVTTGRNGTPHHQSFIPEVMFKGTVDAGLEVGDGVVTYATLGGTDKFEAGYLDQVVPF